MKILEFWKLKIKKLYRLIRYDFKTFIHDIRDYITQGFPDSDTWSLDYSTSYWILPRLKRLRETLHGYPAMLYSDEEANIMMNKYDNEISDKKLEEWKQIIDKMILAFELVVKENDDPDYDDYSTKEKRIEHQQKVDEGLLLFAKYFQCLWD